MSTGTLKGIETFETGGILYYLPSGIDEIKLLIREARQHRREIRIRGAYHSVQAAVDPDKKGLYVMLSKMNKVVIDKAKQRVTVEAGCHLGFDNNDPTGISTPENSLFRQLDAAGFAVPDMGGIIHQTVGGFLSTGASGGSLQTSFGDTLQSLTFVPADSDHPYPVTVSRTDANPNLFYAAGVSMGLLGVIVSASFSIIPRYNIKGAETTTTFKDCAIDMSGSNIPGKRSFRDFLLKTDYKRVLWYPQPRVSKVVVWEAARIEPIPGDFFFRKPYNELSITSQAIAGSIFTVIGHFPTWLSKVRFLNRFFYNRVHPRLLKRFVPLDKKDTLGIPFPQDFQDFWYSGLPMDNAISDKLFPVRFTELWITFSDHSKEDRVAEVLKVLNRLFHDMYKEGKAPYPGGAFCVELDGGKKSQFWMSPAYGNENVIRVDVFWFGKNKDNPSDSYFPLFWKALQSFNFRCHWGKYLPDGKSDQGVRYLKPLFKKWDDFMLFRKKYDPHDIFLSDYWRNHLGL